ncbi:hypothetical protein, partial [Alkalihalophilus marmarensis]|uniref:hypothetical protein n=1 Tax=Alkalihalophilus marmarensis TaxID=521377 RepID=UPI002E20EC51|nr:hypothetical protein [Alkalihalophilus marmarensis]
MATARSSASSDRRPEQVDLDIRAFRGFRYMEGIYKDQERLDVFDIEELMDKRRSAYSRKRQIVP